MLRLPATRSVGSRTSLLPFTQRQSARNSLVSPALRVCAVAQQQARHEHAISNPTLANIEKRWEEMQPADQAELWMQLRDRMKVDWHDLTLQEKKASYWIAFGPHGPRALPNPNDKWYVLKVIAYSLAASSIIFATIRHFARPPPRTMNAEWQAASNEIMKEKKIEPISGVSSEGYSGPGMIQSAPRGKEAAPAEEE